MESIKTPRKLPQDALLLPAKLRSCALSIQTNGTGKAKESLSFIFPEFFLIAVWSFMFFQHGVVFKGEFNLL